MRPERDVLASALIDGSALWKIVVVGVVGGIGVVIACGLVILGVTRYADLPPYRASARIVYALAALLAGLVCVAAVGVGVWAMTRK